MNDLKKKIFIIRKFVNSVHDLNPRTELIFYNKYQRKHPL